MVTRKWQPAVGLVWTRWLCFALALGGLVAVVPAGDPVVRFAVIGDMGIGCDAKDGNQCIIADWLCEMRDQFDFVITVGDNIYPDGDPALFTSRFEEPYQCLLGLSVPFYACLGNHDTQSNGWRYEEANIAYPYYNMFDDRENVRRRYYSFRKGAVTRKDQVVPLVEFLALDSNRVVYPDAPMESDQLPWLERRLRESDAIWKIPYFHHPPYVSRSGDGSDTLAREAFEPFFTNAGVKVVFTGHKHVFEKILPQNGIHYFVSGSAGRLSVGGTRRSSPLLESFNDATAHFLIVEATETALSWRLVDINGEATCYTSDDDQTPIDCRGRIDLN